jgi:hypothetical protein
MNATTLPVALWVASALLGVLTAAVGWLIRTVAASATRADRLHFALYGEHGDNGLHGRVKAIEHRQDDDAEKADARSHKVNAKLHEHETRLTLLEHTRPA